MPGLLVFLALATWVAVKGVGRPEIVEVDARVEVAASTEAEQEPRLAALEEARETIEDPAPAQPEVTRRRALPLFRRKGPPDWVESGDASVVVRVVDGRTRAPGHGQVDLWRIDAPGNESWSRGDQRQQIERLDGGVVRFDGLAPGLYRVFLTRCMPGAREPEPFEVTEGTREVLVEAEFPRRFPLYLDVRLPDGSPVDRVDVDVTKTGGSLSTLRPRWLRPRHQLAEPSLAGGAAGSSSRRRLRDLRRTESGFLIREVWEASRADPSRWLLRVSSSGLVARGVVEASAAIDSTVTVVLADPEAACASFRDGTGQIVEDLSEHLRISGGVVVSSLPDPWTIAEFEVKVDHPDYEPCTVRWIPFHGPPPGTVLAARGDG